MMLEFLWRAGLRGNDTRYFALVELTLDRMCQGGIYDHLGGGFSRYSVDERWLVPHFEKMLYDNAPSSWSCSRSRMRAPAGRCSARARRKPSPGSRAR